MGHRIELGEIEAALETVEGVDRAVCLFLEEKNKIAAFYEGTAVKRDIAIGLESLLAALHVSQFIQKPRRNFPVPGTAKSDRQALRRLYG